MENLDLKESSGTSSIEKFYNNLEKDFITNCGDVSRNSEGSWRT
jgi:hypothetical protein